LDRNEDVLDSTDATMAITMKIKYRVDSMINELEREEGVAMLVEARDCEIAITSRRRCGGLKDDLPAVQESASFTMTDSTFLLSLTNFPHEIDWNEESRRCEKMKEIIFAHKIPLRKAES
jgi:hypothetical protein